ncbi:hypothetical protein [Corynebacterium kalidii]|uniref:Uncharacterized protein n=1 Tax=Corynebacterium kalidii TaxID=2931982 RepID=A0A9X1WL33_9CORY|nr:hypothetical protein [Corynebacterium kalidii]MCJ7859315.1 hypothetical protein [Corynebacterium kalidii]
MGTDTTATTTTSLRSLIRRPFSALRPAPSATQAAERCAGVLRHPRSRIQGTPGWRAPSLLIPLPSGPVEVLLARHRVSPRIWRTLTGADADSAPPADELHLVTTTALAPATVRAAHVPAMTAEVHFLFRRILLPRDDAPCPDESTVAHGSHGPLGPLVPWHSRDACAEPTPDGRHLEWTWHALWVGHPRRPASTGPTHGRAA